MFGRGQALFTVRVAIVAFLPWHSVVIAAKNFVKAVRASERVSSLNIDDLNNKLKL